MRKLTIAMMLITALWSCSLTKNPQSSNFNRVKYNAHLKKSNKLAKEEVSSNKEFSYADQVNEEIKQKEIVLEKLKPRSGSIVNQLKQNEVRSPRIAKEETIKSSIVKEKMESRVYEELPFIRSNGSFSSADWWEDDPEDWPWGQIILALVAFLLVVAIIVVIIDLLGGLLGGLFGLILLLLLAYLLYEYWL